MTTPDLPDFLAGRLDLLLLLGELGRHHLQRDQDFLTFDNRISPIRIS
jgi:hypothetical protein